MDYLLFTYANDRANYLPTLDREREDIESSLNQSPFKESFKTNHLPAATTKTIIDAILKNKEELSFFHYSGHAGRDQLNLEGISAKALGIARLLRLCPKLKLVVLNGCSTKNQVNQLLGMGIPIVIATHAAVNDQSAFDFSTRFYSGLAEGKSIGESFELAILTILTESENPPEVYRGIGKLKKKKKFENLWGIFYEEEKKPLLEYRLYRPEQNTISNISSVGKEKGKAGRSFQSIMDSKEATVILENVAKSLNSNLEALDRSSDWSMEKYVPLDTEVEVQRKSSTKKKVRTIDQVFRYSQSGLFLLLGEPGGGKSIALRRLAQSIYKRNIKKNIFTVYINLREWKLDYDYSYNNQEKLRDFFFSFVSTYIEHRLPPPDRSSLVNYFGPDWFNVFYNRGYFYFILDSFDEIPLILNQEGTSTSTREIARLVYSFLNGTITKNKATGGVLASRYFKSPDKERDFTADTVLEIQPLNEEKMFQIIGKRGKKHADALSTIIRHRPDLIRISTNPLLATLIAEFISDNPTVLPDNHLDLYEFHISKVLQDYRPDLNQKEILLGAAEIAHLMLKKTGLEVDIVDLQKELPALNIGHIIDVLVRVRIGRKGLVGSGRRFSFTHRRFAEFFAVQKMIKNDSLPPMESIFQVNQWRDALVLYCQVGKLENVKKIGLYVWTMVKENSSAGKLMLSSYYQFLIDAFILRLEGIEEIKEELVKYLEKEINWRNEMIAVKMAVELVGLVPNHLNTLMIKALQFDNYWIEEAAFRACRRELQQNRELEINLKYFIDKFSFFELLRKYPSLFLSLSLANLPKISTFLRLKLIDGFLLVVVGILLIIFFPITSIFYWSFFLSLSISLRNMQSKLKGWLGENDVMPVINFRRLFSTLRIILIPVIIYIYFLREYVEWLEAKKYFGLNPSEWLIEFNQENPIYHSHLYPLKELPVSVQAVIIGFIFVVLIPFYRISLWKFELSLIKPDVSFKEQIKKIKIPKKGWVKFMLKGIGQFLLVLSIAFAFLIFTAKQPKILLIASCCFIALAIVIGGIYALREDFRYRRIYQQFNWDTASKETVYEMFYQLEGSRYQLKLVLRLKQLPNLPGKWPVDKKGLFKMSSKRPYTILNELKYKWSIQDN